MKVIIQKVDLDTCLAALILDVCTSDEVVVVTETAKEDILNPEILCIEAGGSGLVELNNFDHHDPYRYYPPACRQAYMKKDIRDKDLERLVEYVCMVDERPDKEPPAPFPSLSGIFSGMLLIEREIKDQFFKGIGILKKVLDGNIDPFSVMPDLPEWRMYTEAKRANMFQIQKHFRNAIFYYSRSGIKVGFLRSTSIGGIGSFYKKGCDVAVLFNPEFGNPPRPKFTIAGKTRNLVNLLPFFDKMEKGWGGRERIIGSPRSGTHLKEEEVLEIVLEHV